MSQRRMNLSSAWIKLSWDMRQSWLVLSGVLLRGLSSFSWFVCFSFCSFSESIFCSSFGKPRRFSKQFLQEEREKLSQYHESVGQQYPDLQSVVREGLPTDLARPLAVGQGAIACHPKTRELQDGSVLTVDRNRCRVLQIDGSELKSGYEFVMGTNMQREVTHLRWKIMCEVSSSRVNIRDLPGYLLANDW
jgi:hypothetical protein